MTEKTIRKLLNTLIMNHFVNLHSENFSLEDRKELDEARTKIRESAEGILVDLDIQVFDDCETQEEEAQVLLKLINQRLASAGFPDSITGAMSIADGLNKFSGILDKEKKDALVILYGFTDTSDEVEKDVLRSVRLLTGLTPSPFLGVLLISDRPVREWELFPESNIDERHLAFFDIQKD